jgi:outer membrane biosynthesis protein TonB
MKKTISAILMLFLFINVANASTLNGTYDGNPIAKIIVNGEEVNVTGTPAYAEDGSVMVPIRVLRELGVGVSWDQTTYSVTITPPEPVEVIKEVVKVVDNEGNTVEEPVIDTPTEETAETPTETSEPTGTTEPTETPSATPEPTPSPEPTPDNTATCKAIADSWNYKIAVHSAGTVGKYQSDIAQMARERDSELASAGC